MNSQTKKSVLLSILLGAAFMASLRSSDPDD